MVNINKIVKYLHMIGQVVNENEDTTYSLEHALPHIQKKKNLKACRLVYMYEEVRYCVFFLKTLLKHYSLLTGIVLPTELILFYVAFFYLIT